jgi:hypothetical protein
LPSNLVTLRIAAAFHHARGENVMSKRKRERKPSVLAATGTPPNAETFMDTLAALGGQREIPTPEGEAKMSAVVLELAKPLLKEHGKTGGRAEAIISLTVAGWNKSMFPPDKQPAIEKDLIDCFVPKDGSAENIGVAVHIMDLIADRRKKLFPDLRKIILDYDLRISEGFLTLNVTSAPIPDLD